MCNFSLLLGLCLSRTKNDSVIVNDILHAQGKDDCTTMNIFPFVFQILSDGHLPFIGLTEKISQELSWKVICGKQSPFVSALGIFLVCFFDSFYYL